MLQSLLAGVVLLGLIVPGTAAASEPPPDITFDGAGWGHGVGMSQYGAYGMAVEGHTADEIISHYYAGASVGSYAASPIWVNLERDFEVLQLTVGDVGEGVGAPVTVTDGATEVLAVSGSTIDIAASGTGCVLTVTAPEAAPVVLDDPDCSIDMQWYDWSTAGTVPTTKVTIVGCLLADWNVSPTIHRPCEYARGMLHLRTGPGGLDLSAEMLIEDYVVGTSEMPYSWDQDALQAQAIASRSYAIGRQLDRGDPATNSCDGWCHVKDSISDQRYVGWGHSNTGPWIAAVQATAGEIVSHPSAPNGVVTAYFSSSSGGLTENVEEKFGGSPKAYLVSVDDSVAVDGTVFNPKASWVTPIAHDTVAAALGLDLLLDVSIVDVRTSGSAAMLEFSGLDSEGAYKVVQQTGTWTRTTFGLFSEWFTVGYQAPLLESDEIFFYRSSDGTFKYYNTSPAAKLGSLLKSGLYSQGWDSITAVDLDGDSQDEVFFYRSSDGVFKYYDVKSDGTLGAPIKTGVYSLGWDSITAVDLDGDAQDELFFYRSSDGTFKYYDVKSTGALGAPIKQGVYSLGWDSITRVDVDGDGQDEFFFYRSTDGTFKYYDVTASGSLGNLLSSGTYSVGWSAITAVDLDGDEQDELFFYRSSDGTYKYYNVKSSGSLGALLSSGFYSVGWDSITALQLD